MRGRRPLNPVEERQLLRVVRGLKPRNRALITAQMFTGFRVSEVLFLKVGDVLRNGALASKIGVRPASLKGHYGTTRWVPVLPELARALQSHLAHMRRRWELTPDLPLFLSPIGGEGGVARPLHRDSARLIIRAAFKKAAVHDDNRLGSHTFRKTWARRVYENSGHDINLTRAALGHGDVSVTQRYLDVDQDKLEAAMASVDWTRQRRPKAADEPLKIAPSQMELLPPTPYPCSH
jgi:integrase